MFQLSSAQKVFEKENNFGHTPRKVESSLSNKLTVARNP
jgi:hypothetical protein